MRKEEVHVEDEANADEVAALEEKAQQALRDRVMSEVTDDPGAAAQIVRAWMHEI